MYILCTPAFLATLFESTAFNPLSADVLPISDEILIINMFNNFEMRYFYTRVFPCVMIFIEITIKSL